MTETDLVGLAGAVIVVAAYLLMAGGKLASGGRPYYLLNFTGAALVLVSLFWAWNAAAAMVEIFWAAISLYGLLRPRRPKPGSAAQPRPR